MLMSDVIPPYRIIISNRIKKLGSLMRSKRKCWEAYFRKGLTSIASPWQMWSSRNSIFKWAPKMMFFSSLNKYWIKKCKSCIKPNIINKATQQFLSLSPNASKAKSWMPWKIMRQKTLQTQDENWLQIVPIQTWNITLEECVKNAILRTIIWEEKTKDWQKLQKKRKKIDFYWIKKLVKLKLKTDFKF